MVAAPSTGLLAVDTPWHVVLDAYLNADLNSPNSVAAYRHDCTVAFERMGVRTLSQLNGALLAAYRAEIMAGSLAPTSVARRMYALRGFLKWSGIFGAHQLDDRVINASLKPPRSTVRTPYRVLKSDDAVRLWEVAAERPVTYGLLCICMGAGLRISEISHLRIRDCYLDLEGGPALHVHQGKGLKDRTVPMRLEFFQGIVVYLESTGRTLNSPGRVFIASDRCTGPTSTGITAAGLQVMLRKVVGAAGIDTFRFNVHALRHTYALGVLRHSHDVVAVQKLLGHSSVTTTSRYVDHLGVADLRDALPGSGPAVAPAATVRGLTTAEAAAILGVTAKHVGYLCDKGVLKDAHDHVGTRRNRLITPESVEALRLSRHG